MLQREKKVKPFFSGTIMENTARNREQSPKYKKQKVTSLLEEKEVKKHSNPWLSKHKRLINAPATLSKADLAFSGWPYQVKILLESNEHKKDAAAQLLIIRVLCTAWGRAGTPINQCSEPPDNCCSDFGNQVLFLAKVSAIWLHYINILKTK